MTILSGLLVLGFIIVIHELGHYLAARLCGVHVFEFSVGFGRKIVSIKPGSTEFSLRLIPLGGFVSVAGLDGEDSTIEPEKSFAHKNFLQKVFIVFAGPLANFFTAIIFVWLAIYIYGIEVPSSAPVVGDVISFSPAQKAGIQAGDRILEVAGKRINSFSEIADIVQGSSGAVEFKVDRKGEILSFSIEPEAQSDAEKFILNQQKDRKVVGIVASFDYTRISASESFATAVTKTVMTSVHIIRVVGGLITGKISKSEIGGPLVLVSEAAASVKKGFRKLLLFMFILSVNLALLNLLPIPLLDGGHILMLSVESLIRRPVPHIIKNAINLLGLAFLILLTLFVLKNDIRKLFGL